MPEWLSFSGWRSEEVVNPETGGPVLQWKSDSSKEGFVRQYAATSPAEDWADTVAYFRYEPETALQNSPRKSAYISQKVFGGRTFDPQGLFSYYSDFSKNQVSAVIPEVVDSCIVKTAMPRALTQNAQALKAAIDLKFDFNVEFQLQDCLRDQLAVAFLRIYSELKRTEFEACDFLSTRSLGLATQVVTGILPQLSEVLSRRSEIAEQLRAVVRLREDLKIALDPREAFLKCQGKESAQNCFSEAVGAAFDEVSKAYSAKIPLSLLEQEKRQYLTAHAWGTVRSEVSQLFNLLFSGIEVRIQQSANNRWNSCRMAIGNEAMGVVPPTQPFSGGDRFVSGSILKCINDAALRDLDEARDVFSGRLGLTASTPEVQVFLRSLWLPIYLEVLNRLTREEFAQEDAERNAKKPVVVGLLLEQLSANQDWSNGLRGSSEGLFTACLAQASAAFDTYYNDTQSGDRKIPTRFAPVEDVRKQWAGLACKEFVKKYFAQKPPSTGPRSGRRPRGK
jgi:hypothetical protein